MALPSEHEETAPAFLHRDRGELPVIEDAGARVRLIAGELFGVTAPVETRSALFYADVALDRGARLPVDAVHEERAIDTLAGEIEIAGDRFAPGQLLVFRPGDALDDAELMRPWARLALEAAMRAPSRKRPRGR